MKRILIALAIISILTGCYSSGIDYAKFGAGFATGLFVIHEGSHKLSGEIQGDPVHFHGSRSHRDDGMPSNTIQHMSGLFGNALAGEMIIRTAPKKRDPFWTGVLWSSALELFTYPVLRGDSGDFASDINHKNLFRIGFSFHGLSLIWRELRR